MRDVPDWDRYFMDMARLAATRSKDPNTQVGAVLVRDRDALMTGYNGFAPGVAESHVLWERPTKYSRVIHAEVNAIARCARRGVSTDGATLYVTHFPCNKTGCARIVIAAGIKRVVVPVDDRLEGWGEDQEEARRLLNEAGVDTIALT